MGKKTMRVTIKQIAEMAGVHRSTVDKVLHHREGVSEPVRKRVQQIIDEYHYEVNPIGKALKMQSRPLRFGVLLLQVDALPYIKEGIEQEKKTYQPFQIELDYAIVSSWNLKEQIRILQKFREERLDGIILMPINSPDVVKEINLCTEENIPVITVNLDIKGSSRFCYIGQDGYKAGKVAGRLMGEFLGGQGNIVIFTSDGDSRQIFPFGTREDGFCHLMEQYYPQVKILERIETAENPEVMERETERVLKQYGELSGILITCGCVKNAGNILLEKKRQDLRLICYEDYQEIQQLMKAGVVNVTLASGLKGQGETALKVLADWIIYEKKPKRKHLYSDIHILVPENLEE